MNRRGLEPKAKELRPLLIFILLTPVAYVVITILLLVQL